MPKDEFVEEIDVTPDKKILRSIATDIDLKRGILELVDDAIDEYQIRHKSNLKVELRFDVKNKTLSYEDDVGGIKEDNMSMVIQPGGTTRTPSQETIGEFGLGLKRAIVALSTEAEVISRFGSLDTFKIIVDDSWIASRSWKIRKYKLTPDIQRGSTVINVTKLKFDINPQIVSEIRTLLGQTYGLLLSTNLTVWVDGDPIEPIRFDGWSYPPEGRHPRTYKTIIKISGRKVNVDITVGLMLKSHPAGEYGFDIYCNNRLILKDYKAPEIGFMTNLLGRPHPAISWFRGIVRITGQNQDMPWNSTKSGFDFANPVVSTLKANLLKLSKPYTRLSRRFDGDSQAQIVPYSKGTIEIIDLTAKQEFTLRPDQMPSIPPRARSEAERVMNLNEQTIKERPWTRALIENFYVADMILDIVALKLRSETILSASRTSTSGDNRGK
jgi:hypothetical protein